MKDVEGSGEREGFQSAQCWIASILMDLWSRILWIDSETEAY